MKLIASFSVVFSLGVGLGLLLSLVVANTEDSDPSAITFDEPQTPKSTDVNSNQTPLKPSSIDDGSQTTFGRVRAIVLEAETLTLEGLQQKLLTMIGELNPDADRQDDHLIRIYVTRMVALNPLETMAFLSSESSLARFHYRAFCDWTNDDLGSAIQYFLVEGEQSSSSFWRCFLRHPEIESRPNFAEIKELVGQDFDDQLERRRLRELPPWKAFELAGQLSRDKWQHARQEAASRWAKQDLTGFLQVLRELPPSNDTRSLISNSLREPMREDPITTMRAINSYLTLDENTVLNLYGNVVANMAFDEAIEFIQAYSTEFDPNFVAVVARSLFRRHPEKSLAYFESLPSTDRRKVYGRIANEYGRQSPAEALAWAMSLGSEFDAVQRSLFSGVAGKDPSVMKEAFIATNELVTRRLMFEALARQTAGNDPKGTLEWLADYESEPGYARAISDTFRQWVGKDPWAAGDYVREVLTPDEPVPMMDRLIGNMYRADAKRTVGYVDGLPPGIAKQQAVSRLAYQAAVTDPREAYSMVENLEDPKVRAQGVWRIASYWASRDPNRINEIAELMELSEDQIAQLRTAYLGSRE